MPKYSQRDIERLLGDLPRPEFRARLRKDLMPGVAIRPSAAPILRVRGAAAAIDFYVRAFGAHEQMRFEAGGTIPHAEIVIGDALLVVADENPEYGFPGPETVGGSTVGIRLDVDDVDAAIRRAVDAGARVARPASDQFYGERSGQVFDPFGYRWTLTKVIETMAVDEMQRRMASMTGAGGPRPPRAAVSHIPAGFHTVTAYPRVADAPALVEFLKRAFGAEQTMIAKSESGVHAEVRLGDSMLKIGGGASGIAAAIEPAPTAFHLYVPDVDAAYERALAAGAESMGAPQDMVYGERGCGVKDPSGNVWYVATAKGASHQPPGAQSLMVFLHPRRAEPVIAFMQRAFGATGVEKFASPDGVVHHAQLRIGDAVIEMGEANGPYQPMPARFYLYVEHVDAAFWKAIGAGATATNEPADQPYGERMAGVKDPFGNQWFIAARL
ncbi:MAG TPA: VOC family protein [Vicinamibacterales bacterium]|nr:VOC family protein [Vicinamibacterales bacterium]